MKLPFFRDVVDKASIIGLFYYDPKIARITVFLMIPLFVLAYAVLGFFVVQNDISSIVAQKKNEQ